MAIDSIRVRADLSDFVTDNSRFRWMHVSFSDFVKIGDLMDHIKSEYFGPDALHELELFLDETPFCLPSWENIRILRDGDIVKAKLRAKKRKKGGFGEDCQTEKKKKQKQGGEATEPTLAHEIDKQKIRKKKKEKEMVIDALQNHEDQQESSSLKEVNQPNGSSETMDEEQPAMDDDSKLLETGFAKRKRKRKRKPRNKNLLPPEQMSSFIEENKDSTCVPNSAATEKPDTPSTSEDENESVLSKAQNDVNVEASHQIPSSPALKLQTNGFSKKTFESSFPVVSCEEALLGSSRTSSSHSLPFKASFSRGSSCSSPAVSNSGDFSRLLQLAQRPVVVTREKRTAPPPRAPTAATTATNSAAFRPISAAQPPNPGQKITFRVMEIRDDYTPGLSEPYEGHVVKASAAGLVTNVRKKRRMGKFELLQPHDEENGFEGDEEIVETVSHAWEELIEPKLVLEDAVQ